MKEKLTQKLQTIGLIWLLASLLTLNGCYDVINPPKEINQSSPSGGLGRVVLSIGEGQRNARTLMPTETPAFTRYDLTFTASGKATVIQSLTTDTDKNSLIGTGYRLDLEPATWDVTATAYTGTQAAASGTTTVTVNTGGTSSVNISLAPLAIADGKEGIFSWNFNTSGITGGISGRTATLTPVKDGVSGTSISLGDNSGSIEVESGYYNLVVQFEKTVSGTALKAGIYEAVHIYPGLTTKAEYTFTDADFATRKNLAGTVDITLTSPGTVEQVMVQAYKEEECSNALSSEFTAQSSPWNWLLEVPSESATIWFKITVKLNASSIVYTAKAKVESIPLEGKAGISLAADIGVGVPGGLTVTGTTSSSISISWASVSGATSYRVFRYDSLGGAYYSIADDISGTSFTDTGLTAGTRYYYKVSAVNGAGEGTPSAISGETNGDVGVPGGLSASGESTTSIIISWGSVSDATKYRLYRSDSLGGTYSNVIPNGTSGTSYRDRGLQPGTTYYYKVSGVNNTGEGSQSAAVFGTTATQGIYPIGSTGPAGGRIFYDKGSVSDGWRYLEVAPASAEFSAVWGGYISEYNGYRFEYSNYISVSGTSYSIGSGKANTEAIVAKLGNWNNGDYAAKRCKALSIGGYNDWFLPSYDELDEIGLPRGATYWSSSQDDAINAKILVLQYNVIQTYRKENTYVVRAVRAF